MRILHINLIQEWFKRHLEDKTEDYREITVYWVMRLMKWENGSRISKHDAEWIAEDLRTGHTIVALRYRGFFLRFRKFDVCQARNGYSVTAPMWRKTHNETTIGIGNPVWGAPSHPVFIIKLGEIIETKNIERL